MEADAEQMDELKLCPVCGSVGIVKLFHIYNEGFVRNFHFDVEGVAYTAECTKRGCKVRTAYYRSMEEATNAWNQRRMKWGG